MPSSKLGFRWCFGCVSRLAETTAKRALGLKDCSPAPPRGSLQRECAPTGLKRPAPMYLTIQDGALPCFGITRSGFRLISILVAGPLYYVAEEKP